MIDQLFEFVQNHPLLVGAFVAVLAAWLAYEAKTGNHGVDTGEATKLVNRDDAVIVDIRDPKEFKAGHIAGARNSPQGKLDERLNNIEISQARLEEKFDAQEKIVTELKGSQNKQIWALIILAFTAVVSLVIGLGKFIFYPNS